MTTTLSPQHASRLSPLELAAQLASRAVTVIDVRDPGEFASGHIAGSLNIPLATLGRADLPDGPLVLVCRSGKRSRRALSLLQEPGHPHPVLDLEGGVTSWEQAGLELSRPPLARERVAL